MGQFDVGALEDFVETKIHLVKVDGQEIGIVKWHNHFYAVRNVCPHQGGPVCGEVLPFLQSSRVGSVKVIGAAPVILCGWHAWEFNAGTGQSLCDSRLRVKTYPVDVVNGRVLIRVG